MENKPQNQYPIDYNSLILQYLLQAHYQILLIKFKFGHDNKKCKTCRIAYKKLRALSWYKSIRDNLIEYKCVMCNKNYPKRFDKNLLLVNENIY